MNYKNMKKDELIKKINDCEGVVKNYGNLLEENKQLKEANNRLAEENKELKANIKSCTKSIEDNHEKIMSLERTIENQKKVTFEKDARLLDKDNEIAQLEKYQGEYKKGNEKMEQEIKDLKLTIRKMCSAFSEE